MIVAVVFALVFIVVFIVRAVSGGDNSSADTTTTTTPTTTAHTATSQPGDVNTPATTPSGPAAQITEPTTSAPAPAAPTSSSGPTWIPPTGIVDPENPDFTPTKPPDAPSTTFDASTTVYATSGEPVQPPVVTSVDPKRPDAAPTGVTVTPPPNKPAKGSQTTPDAAAKAWLQAACFWTWNGGQHTNRDLAGKYMVNVKTLDSRWILDDQSWAELQKSHVSSGCVNIHVTIDKNNPYAPKGQQLVVISATQVLSGKSGPFQSLPVSAERAMVHTGGKWLVGEVSSAS